MGLTGAPQRSSSIGKILVNLSFNLVQILFRFTTQLVVERIVVLAGVHHAASRYAAFFPRRKSMRIPVPLSDRSSREILEVFFFFFFFSFSPGNDPQKLYCKLVVISWKISRPLCSFERVGGFSRDPLKSRVHLREGSRYGKSFPFHRWLPPSCAPPCLRFSLSLSLSLSFTLVASSLANVQSDAAGV